MALAVSAQNDCKGQVGAYSYDLNPLARRLGTTLLRTDYNGGAFMYSVCHDPAIVTLWDPVIVSWLRANASIKPLASGNDAEGFTLYIPNGQDANQIVLNPLVLTILFICASEMGKIDMLSMVGSDWAMEEGEFSFVSQTGVITDTNNSVTFNLQYVSKGNSCCLYRFKYHPSETKTLDTCFFHKRK
ncbi:uncharacterized protein ACA1_337610 [Acanthamoeba castellanii str. Neff]|uniref:Uncharacterized protein n=1 Tax=Acanthamoeba castellanii (strain ATCC 30010 / Neff) TaxID=1257118 RepID=L8GP08_ACACF|nr:uncharacterized protein ACA1_337610 [Acanthamoeba castellanii str. Neff]ELR14705.1 hypothetical protein ACA1_337610 [Acanthamoeba castellanii str. Neff]